MTPASFRTGSSPRRVVAAALLLALSACYSYAPAPIAPLERGSRVEVALTEPRDFRLQNVTANDIVRIRGEVVRVDDQEVVLSAFRLWGEGGFEHDAIGETARVPRANVAEFATEQVSVPRSALLAGAILATGAIVIAVLSPAGGGGAGAEPPTNGGGTSR